MHRYLKPAPGDGEVQERERGEHFLITVSDGQEREGTPVRVLGLCKVFEKPASQVRGRNKFQEAMGGKLVKVRCVPRLTQLLWHPCGFIPGGSQLCPQEA